MGHDHFAAVARRLSGQESGFEISSELMPDEGHFFFEGAHRQHSLETLRHLINFGDMLLLVAGEAEIGKSALLQEMSLSVKDEVHVLQLIPDAAEGTDGHNLITQLAHQSAIFESPSDSTSDLLQRCLQSYDDLRAQSGKRTVIVIDDFERYKAQELSLLTSAAESQEDDGAWVLVLAGPPSSAASLQSSLSRPKEKLHVIRLKPLSKQETRAFVVAGLEHVGIEDPEVLSETALQWLHLRAKGLPGRIEGLLASALFNVKESDSVSSEQRRAGVGAPTRVLFLIVAALLVSFLFVAQQHKLFAGFFETKSEPQQTEATASNDSSDAQKQRIAMLDRALEQSKKFEEEPVVAASDESAEQVKTPSELQSKDSISQEAEQKPPQSLPSGAARSSSDVISLQNEGLEAAIDDVSLRNSDTELADSNVEESPEAEVQSLPSEDSLDDRNSAQMVSISTKSGGSDAPAENVRRTSVTKGEAPHPAFRDSKWLSTKPKDAYTMQVLGSYREQTARSFIDRARVENLIYIESTYKDKPWYVVLYGEYPTAQEAREAISSLPDAVAKEKPWIRSMSGISAK